MADPIGRELDRPMTDEEKKIFSAPLVSGFDKLQEQWSYLYRDIDRAIDDAFSSDLEDRISLIEKTLSKSLSFEEIFVSLVLNLVFAYATEGLGLVVLSYFKTSSSVLRGLSKEVGKVSIDQSKLSSARKLWPADITALHSQGLRSTLVKGTAEQLRKIESTQALPKYEQFSRMWLFQSSLSPMAQVGAQSIADIHKDAERNFIETVNGFGNGLKTFLRKLFAKQGEDINSLLGDFRRTLNEKVSLGDFSDVTDDQLIGARDFCNQLLVAVDQLRRSDLLGDNLQELLSAFLWARYFGGEIFTYQTLARWGEPAVDPPQKAEDLWLKPIMIPTNVFEEIRNPKNEELVKSLLYKLPHSSYSKQLQQDVVRILADLPGGFSYKSESYKKIQTFKRFSDFDNDLIPAKNKTSGSIRFFLMDLYFRRLYFQDGFRSEFTKLFTDLEDLSHIDSIPQLGELEKQISPQSEKLPGLGPFTNPNTNGPFQV